MGTTIQLPDPTFQPGHELFRDLNHRVRELVGEDYEEGFFFCECADEGCAAALRMSGAEYDALCRDPGCYAVIPGHESPEIDTVVGRSGGYVLVRVQWPVPHGLGVGPIGLTDDLQAVAGGLTPST